MFSNWKGRSAQTKLDINLSDNVEEPHTNSDEDAINSRNKERKVAAAMRVKFPDRIPVVLIHRPGAKDSNMSPLEKCKYLIPRDFTWHQFQRLIRSRLRVGAEQSVFFFVNNRLPSPNDTVGQLDAADGDPEGFLSCVYGAENTFGF